jgi:hypothetical protein
VVKGRAVALALVVAGVGCAPSATVRPGGAGAPVVVRYAGAADAVELIGDMTGWQPVPFQRSGDGWVLELQLPAGRYEYRLALRRGEETVPFLPDGAERVHDGYGGENAVLRVPP